MAKKTFDFVAEATRMLQELGAQPDGRQEAVDGVVIHTRAGVLWCKPYDNWLACRFEDVALARSVVGHDCLNLFSGKWNWHFNKATSADVLSLREQIVRLM